MSLSAIGDQSAAARLRQSESPQRVAARQATGPASPSSPPLPSADPRSLAVLSQALNSFLDQVNGAAASNQNIAYGDAVQAYGAATAAPDGEVTAAAASAARPAAETGTSDAMKGLKDDFDSLVYSLQSMSSVQPVAGSTAHDQLKADVTSFVGKLARTVERIATPAMAAPAADTARTSVAAATDGDAAAAPERPAQRPSLLSALGERLHKHFEDL